jgi:hypothetical protein
MGLVWLISLIAFRRSSALARMFGALMISWLLFTSWGYRILEPLRTPRNVLNVAEQYIPADGQLGMISFSEQFLLFSKRDFTHFSFFSTPEQENRNAWLWMKETPDSYLMVEVSAELPCFRREGAKALGTAHRSDYLLLSDDQMESSCVPPRHIKRFTTPVPGLWAGPP